jgi:hypothetical protein
MSSVRGCPQRSQVSDIGVLHVCERLRACVCPVLPAEAAEVALGGAVGSLLVGEHLQLELSVPVAVDEGYTGHTCPLVSRDGGIVGAACVRARPAGGYIAMGVDVL